MTDIDICPNCDTMPFTRREMRCIACGALLVLDDEPFPEGETGWFWNVGAKQWILHIKSQQPRTRR
jgi:hypothetical protein